MDISAQELEICLDVLQRVADDPAVINDHARMKALIAKIHKTGKKGERQAARDMERHEDRQAHAHSKLGQARQGETNIAPALAANDGASISAPNTLHRPTRCYICKQPYTRLHFFYHLLCPDCAALNYAKRMQRTDLNGRIALVTGGRIKIGYQTALRLLRDGATVYVTTRFAHDARTRFQQEADWNAWQSRLHIYALDLRNLPGVEAFAQHLAETLPHLDILIHNAAQTIKRPLAFYQHLLQAEQENGSALALPGNSLPAQRGEIILPKRSVLLEAQAGYAGHPGKDMSAYFPSDAWDADGQKLDTRPVNSWALRLHEVSAIEMLEVQLVNNIAPFLLNSQLKSLLLRSPFPRRFIINVSAMEGQFARESKTVFHPHTNMAKAALNMMTRTSAADYARDGIYMNSVDTGWITDENPHAKKTYLQETKGFHAPLDIQDGMARIYDPIAQGVNSPDEPPYGHFLKDYAPHAW